MRRCTPCRPHRRGWRNSQITSSKADLLCERHRKFAWPRADSYRPPATPACWASATRASASASRCPGHLLTERAMPCVLLLLTDAVHFAGLYDSSDCAQGSQQLAVAAPWSGMRCKAQYFSPLGDVSGVGISAAEDRSCQVFGTATSVAGPKQAPRTGPSNLLNPSRATASVPGTARQYGGAGNMQCMLSYYVRYKQAVWLERAPASVASALLGAVPVLAAGLHTSPNT